jgi:hypothetical protein
MKERHNRKPEYTQRDPEYDINDTLDTFWRDIGRRKKLPKAVLTDALAYLAIRAVAVQAVVSMAVGVAVAVLVSHRAVLGLLVVSLLGAACLAVGSFFLALGVGAVVIRVFEAEHRAGLRRGLCYFLPFAFLVLKAASII